MPSIIQPSSTAFRIVQSSGNCASRGLPNPPRDATAGSTSKKNHVHLSTFSTGERAALARCAGRAIASYLHRFIRMQMTAASSSSLPTLDGIRPMSPILILDLLFNRFVPSPAPGDSKVKLRPGATPFGYAGRGQSQFVKSQSYMWLHLLDSHRDKTDGPLQGPAPVAINGGDSS